MSKVQVIFLSVVWIVFVGCATLDRHPASATTAFAAGADGQGSGKPLKCRKYPDPVEKLHSVPWH